MNREISEEDTKNRYITPSIEKQGWDPDTEIHMEYAYKAGRINQMTHQRKKVKRLDYLLTYPAHNKLALIEAKKISLPIGTGMQQGLTYARDLQIPFVFTSNGQNFVFYDRIISKEVEIPLNRFPTKESLLQRYVNEKHLNSTEQQLLRTPYYYHRGGLEPRYYQVNAINSTLNAIAHNKKHIMFVMATGTGKTYCAFQIAWRLLHAKLRHHPIRKILYLVDRNVLADQPLQGDFRAFGDEAIKLTAKQWKDPNGLSAYKIYFGLYQQLFSDDGKDNHLYQNFPRDFFDLIIIDEAHRGSANEWSNWHSILNYFAPKGSSTVVVGMTATPKEKKDSNLGYFGKPVYNYTLKQGIDDGFLAPYKVIRVELDKDVEGWRPTRGELDANGRKIPDRVYNSKDFDKTMILPKRTQQVARFVSNYLKKHHERMAKTIFFCENIDHAGRMRKDLINENSDLQHRYDDNYVAQITGNLPTEEVQTDLGRFEDVNSPHPVLVTTSQLLRTGVNAKDVKVIVLDANINSMTEFKQIIGRGTRLDPSNGKTNFVIIDFRNATRLFSDPDFDGKPQITDVHPDKVQQETAQPRDLTKQSKPLKKVTPVSSATDTKHHQYIYRVNDVNVKVLDAQVSYVDKDGKLRTTNVMDYSRRNLLGEYPNLKAFLNKWNRTDRKSALLQELPKHGILLNEIRRQTKHADRYDDFDLLIHLAYDRPALTKRDRVNHVKKQGILSKYRGPARAVLEALLHKYTEPDIDIPDLENIKTLNLPEFSDFGGDVNVVLNDFGGKPQYEKAIKSLTNSLYAEEK